MNSAASPPALLSAVVAFYAHLNPRVDAVARLLEAHPTDAAARSACQRHLTTTVRHAFLRPSA